MASPLTLSPAAEVPPGSLMEAQGARAGCLLTGGPQALRPLSQSNLWVTCSFVPLWPEKTLGIISVLLMC